ncbi:hypothetical protein ALC57_00762 [Trachymyrmex cornetzi]|uniref:Chitin-binding type-2 domain-containing protein n=2 Tax=Trachymyrmex cornetzi TaxID=471704 RepID=A0A151JQX3_9HYME|nr:hypothetical protein ALC57_00762 [Trachymyrmex cornetzi]
MPRCTRYGRFPVPGHCSMFYTCDTNGHRLYQSVFKCPQNTGYQVDRGVCNIVADCVNDNSVDTTVCVPDAPGEDVEISRLDEAVDGNVEEISEILEESKASTDDPIVEKKENVNFKNFDGIIITTPVSIIGPLSEDNDNDTEVSSNNASSLNPIKEDLISEGSDEKIMYSQTPNQLKTMQKTSDEGQNEEDGSSLLNLRITSPLTTELDDTSHSIKEQYRNNEDSTVTPSNFNNDSVDLYSAPTVSDAQESTPISDVSPNINEKMQDAATEQYKSNEDSRVSPSNLNSDSVDLYSAPTMSNVPETSLISDVSPNVDENMQDVITEQYKNNEDSTLTPSNFNTDSVDQYSAPTISNVQESTPISNVLPNINEKMQDAATEQYKSNEDSIVPPSNLNSDSVDLYSAPTMSNIPETSLISDVSPNVDENMQDIITEQYKNNEDSTLTPSNFNTDSVDQYSAPTISNVQESTPISNVLPNINEKMQDAATEQYKSNEDSIVPPSNFNSDSVDLYSAPTMSNVPETSPISDVDEKMQDAITEQYKNNEDRIVPSSNLNSDSVNLYSAPTMSNVPESSPISDVSPNVDDKMQDAITEQHRNDEDSTMTPLNFNTDSVDSASTINNVPESFPISDVSPNVDEKMQDAITEQNRNNEDSTMTPSNFNTDSVDQYTPPIVSNVAESSPISDTPSKIDERMQDEATEQYRNNEDSIVTPSNFYTDSIDKYPAPIISNVPESSPISDVSPNIDGKMQDAITEEYRDNEDSIVTPSTLNTDQYPAPTISNISESSLISDVSPNLDEKMEDAITEEYRNNEDSIVTPSNLNIDTVDQYPAPTVSNIAESSPVSSTSSKINEETQDADTEQSRNNEDSTLMPSNWNSDLVDPYLAPRINNISESSPISDVSPNLDEKMEDAITEEYRNNEDSIVTPLNFNTDSIDKYPVPTISNGAESSPISSMSSKIDEEMQDVATEQDRNNKDSTSNFNTGSITDNPRYDDSDILSTPSILPPQAAIDQIATEGLSEVTPSIDSKIADASSFAPDEVESFSARYLPDNTDELYLTPTTGSTFSKEVTAPDDIATTIHPIQEPPILDRSGNAK